MLPGKLMAQAFVSGTGDSVEIRYTGIKPWAFVVYLNGELQFESMDRDAAWEFAHTIGFEWLGFDQEHMGH